ncbi:AraC family ligand binding domain-containing protein [Photobacterium japonica]|uniref:AraC family ligand binding domain-containing protein n=1 Tax=Photobacterium japonica TaxID=2910235 RepID=UPI003D10A5D0
MKQAIDFSTHQQTFLHVGARRKSPHALMLIINQGCVLIRLGQQEFTVTASQGFFIPFDCLHAVTVLPGTHYHSLAFSARLTTPLCREAGYFTVSPLIAAVANELASAQQRGDTLPLSGESGNLLRVLSDQASKLKVKSASIAPGLAADHVHVLVHLLKGDKVTNAAIATTIAKYIGYSLKEIETCLLMREAARLSRSGRKVAQIAEALHTTPELLNAMANPILGESL